MVPETPYDRLARMLPATVKRLAVMASCLMLAAAAGCGSSSKPHAAAAASSPAQGLNLSVVAIEARIGGDTVRSSGTVIAVRRGLILTSAHSVWGATSLRIFTGIGVLHGRVVARAPCDDLALLETQPRLPGLVSLGDGPAASTPSMLVTAVGRRAANVDNGSSSLLTIPVRASAGTTRIVPGLHVPALPGTIRLDSDLVSEATGGPLIDRQARPVGMAVVVSAPNRRTAAVALPWSSIQARLDELRPGARRIYVGWHSQYRCVKRMHAFARAAHPGFRPLDARLNAPVTVSRLPGTEELDR